MIEWLYVVQLWIALGSGALLLGGGLIGRVPSGFSLFLMALVELGLMIQFGVSAGLVFSGQEAATDTLEFFGYLVVALLVPLAAAFWSLVERTRWSSAVLGVAAITVAVMLVRMQQLWTGVPQSPI